MTRRLVTIGISHYCEKARWALERAELAYTESAYAPGFHVPAVKRAGGSRSTPVLVDGDRVVADSTDILDHVQGHPDARWRPWPAGPLEAEARALEARFDDELGPHVRRYAYFHLLPDRAVTCAFVGARTPALQTRLFKLAFPAVRALIRRSLGVDAAGAARSEVKFEAVFRDVEARLADGRRYLVGDRFTGADLAFASLGGVALLHPRYLDVPLDGLPPGLATLVARTRARPAGRFMWRLFEEERREPATL